jgi:hypothetical protein
LLSSLQGRHPREIDSSLAEPSGKQGGIELLRNRVGQEPPGGFIKYGKASRMITAAKGECVIALLREQSMERPHKRKVDSRGANFLPFQGGRRGPKRAPTSCQRPRGSCKRPCKRVEAFLPRKPPR